jgi:hypothetical protein
MFLGSKAWPVFRTDNLAAIWVGSFTSHNPIGSSTFTLPLRILCDHDTRSVCVYPVLIPSSRFPVSYFSNFFSYLFSLFFFFFFSFSFCYQGTLITLWHLGVVPSFVPLHTNIKINLLFTSEFAKQGSQKVEVAKPRTCSTMSFTLFGSNRIIAYKHVSLSWHFC